MPRTQPGSRRYQRAEGDYWNDRYHLAVRLDRHLERKGIHTLPKADRTVEILGLRKMLQPANSSPGPLASRTMQLRRTNPVNERGTISIDLLSKRRRAERVPPSRHHGGPLDADERPRHRRIRSGEARQQQHRPVRHPDIFFFFFILCSRCCFDCSRAR